MNRFTHVRSLRAVLAATSVAALVLTGCSSTGSGSGSGTAENSAGNTSAPLYSELPSTVKDAGTINIGSSIDYPPFEYYAPDGKTLQGFEPELASLLESKLGVTFTWNNAPFDALFSALRGNRYDIVYGAVNDTAERQQTFDFVDYLRSSQGFVVGKGNPQNIKVLDDICGKTIAAVRGGVQPQILEAQSATCEQSGKGKIDVLTTDGNSGEQLAVKQGRAAAMLENYPTAATFAKESGGDLELVPDLQISKQYFGMVFDKKNSALRDTLEKAWQQIMDDGSYARVLQKYDLADIAIPTALVNSVGAGS